MTDKLFTTAGYCGLATFASLAMTDSFVLQITCTFITLFFISLAFISLLSDDNLSDGE